MQNTGTFDGTIGFWVLFCFMAPIALAFLSRALWAIAACFPEVKEVPVVVEKIVYRSAPAAPAAPTAPKQRRHTRAAPSREDEAESATDPQIMADTIGCLKKLGFRVTEAKKMVKDLCASKAYLDAESLLNDCLEQLK
jgi:hypothetical protein